MTHKDAEHFITQVIPDARLERAGCLCRVVSSAGECLGSGVSWKSALKAACKPILAKEAEQRDAKQKRAEEAFQKDMAEFRAWKASRDEPADQAPAGNAG